MSNEERQARIIADMEIEGNISALSYKCHKASLDAGWWEDWSSITNDDTREKVKMLEIASKLCLVHSEVSEALEGHRKQIKDDKLPHRTMLEVELADALIRIFDIAGRLELSLGDALAEKLRYNAKRANHKLENRAKPGGKRI